MGDSLLICVGKNRAGQGTLERVLLHPLLRPTLAHTVFSCQKGVFYSNQGQNKHHNKTKSKGEQTNIIPWRHHYC
ncbi:hypothetical protein JGK42_000669 [Aeromonas veronii]|nr:hypothetical protein [Aeromonas veronii]